MPAEPCRPLRILCIDDEPDLREVMHDVLEMDHHQVTVATGGREGLDLFRCSLHAGEPYEVVITDLGMPDIDGRHVARAIKAESPQTPIIMLTGWGAMTKADGQPAPASGCRHRQTAAHAGVEQPALSNHRKERHLSKYMAQNFWPLARFAVFNVVPPVPRGVPPSRPLSG